MATLVCELTQGDNVEFFWAQNGHLLGSHSDKGDRVKIVSDEETSMLKISNVQLTDTGNYSCVAKNSQSEARVAAWLEIEGIARLFCEIHLTMRLSVGEEDVWKK